MVAPHYWFLLQEIHQLLMDSQHKKTLMNSFDIFLAVSLDKSQLVGEMRRLNIVIVR